MTSSAQISALRKKRASIKTACTRIRTYTEVVDRITPELITNLEERREKLTVYWSDYDTVQFELESLCNDEEIDRNAFEEMFFDLTAALRRIIADSRQMSAGDRVTVPSPGVSSDGVVSSANNIRLPKLDLPKFNGRYEEWFPFFEMFNSVINDNPTLSNFQRFQYLRASVTGDAANVIRSLELSDQNYQVAWNLSKQRYDNKRAIVQTHLRALFELPSVAKESAIELRRVADNATKHIQALNALRCPTEHWDDVLIYLISSKFDSSTAREWQASLSGTELPTFKQFADFLSRRCLLLESIGKGNSVSQHTGKRWVSHVATTAPSCGYCRGEHFIYHCREFLGLSASQRLAEARKRKLCTNCLRGTNHSSGKCKSGVCNVCGIKHNSLLHISSKFSERSERAKTENESARDSSEGLAVMTHTSTSYNHCVLLSTAIVYIIDASGTRQTCRVLLDSGSQANFITRSCIERLNLKSRPSSIRIAGINAMISSASEIVEIKLQSRLNGFSSTMECVLTDRITERLPTSQIDREKIRIPQNIKLADPEFYRCSDVDILIGVELFWQLLCVGRIKSSRDHPTLQKTHLGWIVAGRLDGGVHLARGQGVAAFHASVSDAELQHMLAKFWQLEEGFRRSDSYSSTERFCERHFCDNTTRDERGRVMVTLPVMEHKLRSLGETHDIALRRFYSLERRLDRDPNLKSQYKEFMHEYLSLGHMKLMEDIDSDNRDLPAYYLPHHCVLKPSSETTRLRVVFDASCKSSTGISLNDVLMVGPTVQQDLFSIILRFRTFRFVISADITKMYRQILIDPRQTRLQRILWRDNAATPVKIFELQTLTYGTAAASYLATRSIQFLAETYARELPVESARMMRDFYVDDLLTGADTLEEVQTVKDEVVEILGRGGLQLNKWSSNDERLLNNIRGKHSAEFRINKEKASRILGILWSPSMDVFRFEVELPAHSHKITKRVILSEIARLFDPLGLLGPVIVVPKMLLQEMWQLKLHWDESIPMGLHTRWSAFKERLEELNKLNISRFVGSRGKDSHFQIHGFCDASQRAYGACLYIRRRIIDDEFRVDLLCSKTRVAPLKTISIPRLELCAAVLLAQLWDKVSSSVEMSAERPVLWSDSTIALRWISSCSRKWSVFVANRIGEIQRLTSRADWRHVPSADNPADLLSRGTDPHDIVGSALWWHGPAFLTGSEDSWPKSDACISELEMPEMRVTVAAVIRTTAANPFVELVHRSSNLNKLCRVVAYCLRFLKTRFHPQKETGIYVSRGEISAALDVLCKIVQRSAFPDDREHLVKEVPLRPTSSLISLSPFLDGGGLIRVGGRLKNCLLLYNARHPILLPKNHRLTHLIIEREHVRNLHAGLQGTIAAVRQNFWPLSVRSTTQKIIRQCVTCFRCKPILSEARMGVLPPPQVIPSRPFSVCGVDYAGPFMVREGKRRNARNDKAYACVFVCLATKAIHIELAGDLSTDTFLAALKRFISRRGKPSSIHSDNGTNFKGASRQLSELGGFWKGDKNKKDIERFCDDLQITWWFIPPGAPHFGGLWEAAVKSAKYHLQRIVQESRLTFEELQTVLCEIEAILNSRPLTSLSSDPNDIACLTPGHFLIGDTLNGLPCRDLNDVNQGRLIRWERIEQLRQHFWSRWSREYLNQLQQRHKWTMDKGKQLQSGQMVLVKQQGLPPMQWVFGRVSETHNGSDGIARSATVITAKGKIIRPLSKLSILPIEDTSAH